MGRYNLAPQRVHSHATQILQNNRNVAFPPPWYETIGNVPPAQRLVRPALRRNQKPGKRSSRIFSPVNVTYKEDRLRWEYFNDHPWELARPRVVLENDGRDAEKWDWSIELDFALNRPRAGGRKDERGRTDQEWDQIRRSQSGRPLNGESVVQRQHYLQTHSRLSPAAAYDQARKEFYRARHAIEIETRVAREEALSTGAFFGLGPLEVGMKLENQAYENWREWARKEIAAQKQLQSSSYTGNEIEEAEMEMAAEDGSEELQQVEESVPASRKGQEAKGGAPIHP